MDVDADAAPKPTARSPADLCGCPDDARFVMELEMVQCLANPHYLNC